jgi:metal-responsive CopG/Arc/MetJ family transcriptional regulator
METIVKPLSERNLERILNSMIKRVTISVPEPLLRDADRLAKQLGAPTRSGLFVEALKRFVRQARAETIDASLDAYYGARTKSEVAEERAMVRAFRKSRRTLDLDREGLG